MSEGRLKMNKDKKRVRLSVLLVSSRRKRMVTFLKVQEILWAKKENSFV